MVTVVTIVSLCVLFAPLGIMGQRATRRVLGSGWLHRSNAPKTLFAKLGLSPEHAEDGIEARAKGTLRDVPITLTILTTPDRARGNLWIDVDLEGRVPSGVRLSSSSRSLPPTEQAPARADEFALGDEVFDRAFVVSGATALALATMDKEIRALLIALLEDTATKRWSEIHLEGAHLVARALLSEESQNIDALIIQIQDVAFAASQMRFSPDDLMSTLVAQSHEKQSPLYRALCVREVLARATPGGEHEAAMTKLCEESSHSELQLIHYERHPEAFDDDALFELLNAVSTTHRDAEKREWALDTLVRTFGARLIVDTARPMFQRLRLLRAMMAASFSQEELVALMRSVLEGAKTTERREFWGELLELRWEGAIELLPLERLSPPDEATRMHCVGLCKALGGDDCETFLLIELRSPFPSVQRVTIEALGHVGGRASFAPLSALSSSSSPFAPVAVHNVGGDLTVLDEAGGLSQVE